MSRPPDPHAKIDLLRAAEAVFVELGLDPSKVEDITERAGRSKGAFYLHFESKEDAFRQIVESLLARLAAQLDDGLVPEDDLGLSGALGYLEQWRLKDLEIFEFVWANRGVVQLLLEGGKSATFAYLIDEFAERCRSQTLQILRWGVRQGIYRADLDEELASLVIAGAYDRVAREIVKSEKKPDLSRILSEVQRLIVAGLASPALTRMLDARVKNVPAAKARPIRARRHRRSAR